MKVRFNTKRQNDPTRDQGIKVPYAPAKRRVAQWRWYLILLVVSSPLLYFLFHLVFSQVIVSAQGLVTLEKIPINSSGAGYVSRISVHLGDTVSRNQVLVALGSPDLDEREHVLRAELSQLGIPSAPGPSSLGPLLQDRVALARKNIAFRKEKLRKIRLLVSQGAATIAELNQAEAGYDQARLALNRIRSDQRLQLEKMKKENRQMAIQTARRRQVIQARLEAIAEQRKRLAQRAPFPGRILDIFVQANQSLASGAPILLMGRLDHPYVVGYLDPRYSKYALNGHTCTVKFPDGKTIRARVRENPSLTRRLPSDLNSPLGNRDMKILVKLDFMEEISGAESIDGLPVTIRFDFAR